MGSWNEHEARKTAEGVRRKTISNLQAQGKQSSVGKEVKTIDGDEKPILTLFDTGTEDRKNANQARSPEDIKELSDGFNSIAFSPSAGPEDLRVSTSKDPASRLNVFKRVESARGRARIEYGRIYAALSSLYIDAISCPNPTQALVFRIYRDPNQQAIMLSNLERFGRSDLIPGWQERNNQLCSLVEAFEKAVTKEFEQALDLGDVSDKMSKYAHVLVNLNGGHTGIDLFINTNPVIASRHTFGNPLDGLNCSPGNFDGDKSYEFFSTLSSAFNEQVAVVDQVFPSSVDVVVPLIRRIGKQILAEYSNALFDEAHRNNVETYLKAASTICGQALTFAKSLRPSVGSSNDFYEAVDEIISEVFEPHVDLYLAEELAFFKKNSEAVVGEWEKKLSEQDASMQSMFMSNVNRQADKRDFLSSFKKVVMMPVNVLPTSFGGKPATAKALVNGETLAAPEKANSQFPSRSSSPGLINGTTLSANRSASPAPEPPTTELAAKTAIMNSRLDGIRSLFSIEVALNLVHMAKSSIERAIVYTSLGGSFEKDTRLQCELIFIALLQTLGIRHVISGFDQAVEHLSNYNPRETNQHMSTEVEPLVTFLELVNVGDLIQQMLDVFYEQEMVASKLTAKDDFLNPAVKEKKRFEQMLDSRVAAGLNKGIEVLMDEVEYVFATEQKPRDFNPDGNNSSKDLSKASEGLMDIGPSETATKVVEVVERHTKMLVGSTDKNTLDVFNQEVGMRLFAALCKHLKRQRISTIGSIKLIRYVQTSRASYERSFL